jgi:ribose transport system substrate-binding protein
VGPLRRAQGFRDALTGQEGLAALAGEGGWTEVAGCPVFTNDDGAKGVQAMSDILAANPDLVAFGIMGGWPLFGAPQPYRDLIKPLADKIANNTFAIGAADPIGDRWRSRRKACHRARRPAAVRNGQGADRHD